MTLRAVVFDLDDTLVHVPEPRGWEGVTRAQVQLLRSVPGAEVAADLDLVRFLANFWSAFDSRFPEPREPHLPPFREDRWAQGERLLARMLREQLGAMSDALAARWWQALFRVPPAEFGRVCFPDTLDTLKALGDRGFSLCLVTNRLSPADVVVHELEHLGLGNAFDAIVSAGEVGVRKPHAAVFENALAAVGASPDEAIMIGDSYAIDIEPAARLGMLGVLKCNGRPRIAGVDRDVRQVDALDELLRLALLS